MINYATIKNTLHACIISFVAVLSFYRPAYCGSGLTDEVKSKVLEIRGGLSKIRISADDCSVNSRWEIPHIIPEVENLLVSPLDAPVRVSSWCENISLSSGSDELVGAAEEILGAKGEAPSRAGKAPVFSPADINVPADVRNAVGRIYSAIIGAQEPLKKSYANLSAEERAKILRLFSFPEQAFKDSSGAVKPESFSSISVKTPRQKKKVYELLKRFDEDSLFCAARVVTKTIEEEMPVLREWAQSMPTASSGAAGGILLRSEAADVLIAGNGDDRFTDESLKNAVLLIDAGGNNTYRTRVAGAGEGEIRVVIDFGRNIEIISPDISATAGAGIFGIGLLYMPNPSGIKKINSGSFSQGAGLCGTGGVFLSGRAKFTGTDYAQGIGIFGAGIISNDAGDGSVYSSNRFVQGVGLVGGIGIFRHRGSDSAFYAGLADPDPRESLGTTSLAQGVGYGFRAYSGGGVGICVLKGNDNRAESSYFAQGAGYWHSAGAFLMEGSSNTLKARRYDQGSGVHQASGFFFLRGDNNTIINWGVGPAFGWDAGLGWAFVLGNSNSAQAEWGTGTASYNSSRSFSVFAGDGLRLDLPALGSGGYTRDVSDYALSVIEGKNNSLRIPRVEKGALLNGSLLSSPWGMIRFDEVAVSSVIGLARQEWKALPREKSAASEKIDLEKELKETEGLDPDEKIERLVRIASSFTIDKDRPRMALFSMLGAGENLGSVVRALEPADFDGFIQIRVIISIYGDAASRYILDELNKETNPERKAILMSLLSFLPAQDAAPYLIKSIDDNDWRIQVVSMRLLGALFDADKGSPCGRLQVLRAIAKSSGSFFGSRKLADEMLREIRSVPYTDAASLLAITGICPLDERKILLESAPADITVNLDEDKAKNLMSLLRKNKKAVYKAARREIENSEKWAEQARIKIVSLLEESQRYPGKFKKESVQSAIVAAGKIGNGEDAALISRFLTHGSSLVRDGASASLGRLGKHSIPYLKDAFKSEDPGVRTQALVSAARTTEPAILDLLEAGLKDKDPNVRQAAISLVELIQPLLSKEQKKLREKIKNAEELKPRILENERIFLFGN